MSAQPAIDIPSYVKMIEPANVVKLSVHELTGIANQLLSEHSELQDPVWLTISPVQRAITMAYPDHADTFATLASWAEALGSTVTGELKERSDGHVVHCEVKAVQHGARVNLCAYITGRRPDESG